MKNRRGLIIGMWLGLMTGAITVPASAADVPAPGNVKLKIETKRITQAQAEQYVKSGEKVTLGVYLVLDQGWKTVLDDHKVMISSSRLSYAFFEDQTYTIGNYLQSPTDYVSICADKNSASTPSWGCDDVESANPLEWYTGVTWFNPAEFSWPTYAYGGGFLSGMAIYPTMGYFQSTDGNFEIKLFDIQFKLNNSSRDLPVGTIDNLDHTDGSPGNVELNIVDPQLNAYRPNGIVATDWTDSRLSAYFEFVPGGLFIERAPEVEKLEPLK